MAKISIILPIYNQEKCLKKCLDSILVQTNKDFELIAVNDGSTDHSLEILEKYDKKFQSKIIIIDKKNEGVLQARKDALEESSAPYLTFIDSDDYINSQYLESLTNTIEEQNANLAIARFALHFNYPILQKIGFLDKKRKKRVSYFLKRIALFQQSM